MNIVGHEGWGSRLPARNYSLRPQRLLPTDEAADEWRPDDTDEALGRRARLGGDQYSSADASCQLAVDCLDRREEATERTSDACASCCSAAAKASLSSCSSLFSFEGTF
mmetsp:Transcript_12554/g.27137  ORF Transcript_12554/g.27137 Transcript_12554/m.27137 type:complete len:109 (+) Transcript_12554:249-575(+)|eukprot:CAMPEP_0204359948 /NCGR_PEP_ID=MMETSP0469-20131031/37662_1 /ASSEMBLY_ACC=CAM_ASM_000384 /TAXON_ID=2969 /ORGANISM="Oxyrrhis marina" /LENGTH=108 /DNA_ID=CAMNT_0051348083 /DNA_START=292 /DNA_END=618 /DNA_ORIENTATION=+